MGLDEIPCLFLKDTTYVISKPLAHIIYCSLMSGVVPNNFKRARVVPVWKSVVHDHFDNYQLISMLPAISKILEKCVHLQLIEHLEKNNLLSQNQFGFCKYRSLVRYIDQWMLVCLQAPFMLIWQKLLIL